MQPILPAFICLRGTELTQEEAVLLKTKNPLGLTLFKRNIQSPKQLKKLTNDIRDAVGRSDFLIAIDQEGGVVQRLNVPSWRSYMSQQQLGSLLPKDAQEGIILQAKLIANDLRKVGINVNFAPVADVLHDKTTGAVASRCFSDDPKIVSKYADLLSKTYIEHGICPCMKHLPGHGLAKTDSHKGLPVITASQKQAETDFLPFQKMASTVPFGMTAHIVLSHIDNKPITQSQKGIELIRQKIGFDGLLITDALEMRALKGSLTEKVQQSLNAGCDVVCYCSGDDQNNPDMVKNNYEVLDACGPMSDKSQERLEKVLNVIHTKVKAQNYTKLNQRYDELMKKAQSMIQKDCTENWATHK